MKKIISLFQRNYDGDRLVRDEIVPGAEWVMAGEGVATQKFDGTCCMIRDGKLYKRYDAKRGKTPPPNFEPAQEYDEVTGHMPGWIPVGEGPEDKWFREGFANTPADERPDGTYELCGPKIQGNPEGYGQHILVRHGRVRVHSVPLSFEGIRQFFRKHNIEGIVWHHPDGRMVKIKAKDFGLKRSQAFGGGDRFAEVFEHPVMKAAASLEDEGFDVSDQTVMEMVESGDYTLKGERVGPLSPADESVEPEVLDVESGDGPGFRCRKFAGRVQTEADWRALHEPHRTKDAQTGEPLDFCKEYNEAQPSSYKLYRLMCPCGASLQCIEELEGVD